MSILKAYVYEGVSIEAGDLCAQFRFSYFSPMNGAWARTNNTISISHDVIKDIMANDAKNGYWGSAQEFWKVIGSKSIDFGDIQRDQMRSAKATLDSLAMMPKVA